MAITFVGSKTFTAAGAVGGAFAVSLTDLLNAAGGSATLAENDLIVIAYAPGTESDLAYTAPTGYTEDAELYSNGVNAANLAAWRKFMGAAPDTSVGIPNSGDARWAVAGTIFAFRGVDTTTPLDAAITTATGINTGRPDPPAITPATAGAWIVVLGAAAGPASAAFTNPGDLSATTNHFRSAAAADSVAAMAGCGLKADWSSGAFDPAQWTGGSTDVDASWAAATYALRPAATGATYNETLSESAAAGSSLGAAATFAGTIAESAAAGGQAAAAASFVTTLAESAAPTDSVTGGLLYSESLSESASGAAGLAASAAFAPALGESAAGADGLSVAAAFGAALGEAAAAGSSLVSQLTRPFAPDFLIGRIDWAFARPGAAVGSGWTGGVTVVADPWRSRWRAEVELITLAGEAEARPIRSFLARVRGAIAVFRLRAVAAAQNADAGVTVAAAAAAGARSVDLAGYSAPLKDGQLLTVDGQLLCCVADQSGATVTFEPPLRRLAAAGAAVETARPYALVHMAASRVGWKVKPALLYGAGFAVEEAILETEAPDRVV